MLVDGNKEFSGDYEGTDTVEVKSSGMCLLRVSTKKLCSRGGQGEASCWCSNLIV